MIGKNLEVRIKAVVLGDIRVTQVVLLVLEVETGHGEQQRHFVAGLEILKRTHKMLLV